MNNPSGFPLLPMMNNASRLPSAFLNSADDARGDFDRDELAQPKSIAFVSTHLAESPGLCIDAPFPMLGQNYAWKSVPGVPDLSVNQCRFSQMHRQNLLAGKDCATVNGQKNLNSTGSLLISSNFSLPPPGQRSKKPRATTENGVRKLIEKQRRNGMNLLYSMLASLLPEEKLKGKRSVSDQVQEAIDYIKHLQTEVKELVKRRDEFMKISDNSHRSPLASRYEEKICRFPPFHIGSEAFPSLRVNSFGSGLEIVANTFKYQIVFSNFLQVLEEGGLELVTAAAFTVNDKVSYTIHSKISNIHSFESTTLYHRLSHLIMETAWAA